MGGRKPHVEPEVTYTESWNPLAGGVVWRDAVWWHTPAWRLGAIVGQNRSLVGEGRDQLGNRYKYGSKTAFDFIDFTG